MAQTIGNNAKSGAPSRAVITPMIRERIAQNCKKNLMIAIKTAPLLVNDSAVVFAAILPENRITVNKVNAVIIP